MVDADVFKAMSDGNRLRILEMLRNGELCACKILEAFDITQPTLSHHMKVLCDCGLVRSRKVGQWSYYSICPDKLDELISFFGGIRQDVGSCPPAVICPD